MSGAETGNSWPAVGMIWTVSMSECVGRFDQRDQGRIGRVGAVPVPLAVDLHGVAQHRQAPRREHHLAGEFGLAKELQPAIGHRRCGDQQPHGRVGSERLEIDLGRKKRLQGVKI